MKYFYSALILILVAIVGLFLYFFIQRLQTNPIDSRIDPSTAHLTSEEKIQISILNACGKQGLANFLRKYSIDRGFDVVEIGNYNRIIDTSIIIDRLNDSLSVQKVAIMLGLDNSRIIKQVDSSYFVRATIVIGLDYESLKPFSKNF